MKRIDYTYPNGTKIWDVDYQAAKNALESIETYPPELLGHVESIMIALDTMIKEIERQKIIVSAIEAQQD